MSLLFTAQSFGTGVNAFTGRVGTYFTMGAAVQPITHLSRYVFSGSTQSHTLRLYNPDTATEVASVVLNASGLPAGMTHVALASPFTPVALANYYLVSDEFNAGDKYADQAAVTKGTLISSCFSAYYDGAYHINGGASNQSYGMNLMFQDASSQAPRSMHQIRMRRASLWKDYYDNPPPSVFASGRSWTIPMARRQKPR